MRRARWQGFGWALPFGITLACGGPAHRPIEAPPPTAREAEARTGASPRETSLALFERLVAMTRRYHLFAPRTAQNLGRTWDDDLPRLRAEFAAARDDAALNVALFHFGSSLHDVHCAFSPRVRGPRLTLGVRASVEASASPGEGGVHRFYVERVRDAALAGRVSPGDVVVAIDGVPAARLLEEHAFVSNMNSPENVAIGVSRYLTTRSAYSTRVIAGDTSSWSLRSRDGAEKTVTMSWRVAEDAEDDDFAVDYASKDCAGHDAKNYGGGYALTARGFRACVYTSKEPVFRDYPIVRHTSFVYRQGEVPHGVLTDFEVITKALGAVKPKGIIVDVQDNGGGINPNLFIEWWAREPYTDTETRVLLDGALLAGRGVEISSMTPAIASWYAAELQAGGAPDAQGRRLSRPRPFMCKPDTCAWDNRYAPARRVTTAPVALLLGPGCASSCDSFARHFDVANVGPIVGRPSMAGFTTHRARFDVGRAGEPALGTIDFAVAYDSVAGATESIEGVPVSVDVPVPRTFDNHARYDSVLVEAAIRALASARPGGQPGRPAPAAGFR